MKASLIFSALPDLPEIHPGDDLARIVWDSCQRNAIELNADSVIVIAQKVVSKAEGRYVDLKGITPSPRAQELAQITGKDPRLVEAILGESTQVVRAVRGVLIVRHRLGLVMANAGIDHSNLPSVPDQERVLLLPENPDLSASRLRDSLAYLCDAAPGVVISDSFGRPWRHGVTNVAIGCAGLAALIDRRGESDRHGNLLEITQVAHADALAAGAALLMGEGAEGLPVVVIQGLPRHAPVRDSKSLVRPLNEDLFQ